MKKKIISALLCTTMMASSFGVLPSITNFDTTNTITVSAASLTIPYTAPGSNECFRRGSKGNKVRWIQRAMNIIMGAGLSIDGDYGKKTESAVYGFQCKYNLKGKDGIYGPETNSKVRSILKSWGYKL